MEWAGPGVVLDRRGGHKAAAWKGAVAQVRDPRVDDRLEALEARRCRGGWLPHRSREAGDRRLQRRALQRLLAAEPADEAALAHVEVGGQATDREALETDHRGEVDRSLDDRG